MDIEKFEAIPDQLNRIEHMLNANTAGLNHILNALFADSNNSDGVGFIPPTVSPSAPAPDSGTPEQSTPPNNPESGAPSIYKIGVSSTEDGNRNRMQAWYPGVRFGAHDSRGRSGFQGPPSDNLRWKPISDKGGLVVLFPSQLPIESIWMPNGEVITKKQIIADRTNSISNGYRLTVYRKQKGASYGNGLLIAELSGGLGYMFADIIGTSDNHSTKWTVQKTSPLGFPGQSDNPQEVSASDYDVELINDVLTISPRLAAMGLVRNPKWVFNELADGKWDAKPHVVFQKHTDVAFILKAEVSDDPPCGILFNFHQEPKFPLKLPPGMFQKAGGHWGGGWYNLGLWVRLK